MQALGVALALLFIESETQIETYRYYNQGGAILAKNFSISTPVLSLQMRNCYTPSSY